MKVTQLLTELTGYKKFQDQTFEQFIKDTLEANGIDIGRGHFSVVIMIPGKNYVYKVWVDDPGYEKFIEIVEQHQHLPAFPRLLSKIKKVPLPFKRNSAVDYVNVLKMERLDEKRSAAYELLDLAFRWEQAFNNNFKLLNMRRYNKALSFKRIGPELLAFIDALQIIAKEVKGSSLEFDLHAGNIMFRGSQPVVIDPWVEMRTLHSAITVTKSSRGEMKYNRARHPLAMNISESIINIPSGYKIVPVQPTHEMIEAAQEVASGSGYSGSLKSLYKAMVASSPKKSASGVPKGWAIVPVQPTHEMIEAAQEAASGSGYSGSIKAQYKAMVSAAPEVKS